MGITISLPNSYYITGIMSNKIHTKV